MRPNLRAFAAVLGFAALSPLAAGAAPAPAPASNARPRAVVLVVGDGVSPEMITATRIYKYGAEGRLALERYPHSAFVRTWSANSMVTDSSSAATALARGIKAVNGRVGIPEAGKPGPESILDVARQRGWSTGVVSDDAVTGATPAAFFVEEEDRKAYARIARKTVPQLGTRLDLLLGGGASWFQEQPGYPYNEPDRAVVRETAGLIDAARNEGRLRFFDNWEAFRAEAAASGPAGAAAKRAPLLGLFASDTLPYAADGAKSPALLEMARAAVAELDSRGKPYFLMIEAGLPDKAAHMNEGLRAVNEVLEMDTVLDWLDQTLPPDATILATADHGTGGMAVNGYLPLRAKGDTLFIANPGNGLPIVSWATGPGGAKPGEPAPAPAKAVTDVTPGSRQVGAAYTGSAMHTGGDVWMIGRGPGSEPVRGYLDNTDVFGILRAAVTGEKFTPR